MAVMKSPKNTNKKKIWILKKFRHPSFRVFFSPPLYYKTSFRALFLAANRRSILDKKAEDKLTKPEVTKMRRYGLVWKAARFRKRRRSFRRSIRILYAASLPSTTSYFFKKFKSKTSMPRNFDKNEEQVSSS